MNKQTNKTQKLHHVCWYVKGIHDPTEKFAILKPGTI